MQHPLFSVIIPTFNSERFIEETAYSVLNQTMSDFELLFCDDGSTDDTLSIIEAIALTDSRIKILHTPYPSGGPTIPTNIALSVARGSYVAFLDHDDIWDKTKLEQTHQAFLKNSATALVLGNVNIVNETNHTTEVTPTKLCDGKLPLKELLAGAYFNTLSMIAIKRTLLEARNCLDTNLLVFADFDLVLDIAGNGHEYTFIKEPLTHYRIHTTNTSSISRSCDRRIKDLCYLIKKHKDTYVNHPESLSRVYQAIATLELMQGRKKNAIKSIAVSLTLSPLSIKPYAKLIAALAGLKTYSRISSIVNQRSL